MLTNIENFFLIFTEDTIACKKNQKYLLIVKAESFEKVSISMGFVEKETFRREIMGKIVNFHNLSKAFYKYL